MVAEGGRTRLYREGHFRPGIRKFLRETQYISLCGRFFTFLCRSVLKEKPVCEHLHLFSAILDYNFSLLTTLVYFTSLWPSPSFTSLPDSDVSRFSRILPAGVINVINQQIVLLPHLLLFIFSLLRYNLFSLQRPLARFSLVSAMSICLKSVCLSPPFNFLTKRNEDFLLKSRRA